MTRVERHVLVASTMLDVSTDAVVRELYQRGIACTRLNTETYPFEAQMTLGLGVTHATLALKKSNEDAASSLAPTSIWFRRIRSPGQPESMNPGVYEFCLRESRSTLLGTVAALQARVMSKPANVWHAEHKLAQLRTAIDCGLRVPDTVVTNDPEAVRSAFYSFGKSMIAKPARSGFVDYGDEQYAVYTSAILEEHLEHLDDARWSPAIYQRLVHKKCDVRVTYVSGSLFVAEIDSQSDPAARIDWRRTENPDLPHRRANLPTTVEEQTVALMRTLGLEYGAIDFVRTPDDEYVFLEVNPNGQWLWLEDNLGFKITDAIADWLGHVEQ